MLSVDKAVQDLLKLIDPVEGIEEVSLDEANHRVIAQGINSPVDLPPFDSSAMDGYAVISADCKANQPVRLRCIGTSKAGSPFGGTLASGEAIRIFTGAKIPSVCDAVVIQENVNRRGDWIDFQGGIASGSNVRSRGNDVSSGAPLAIEGQRLNPMSIGRLAASGIASTVVRRRIHVGIMSTGDELCDPGTTLGDGQIFDSNRQLLRSLLNQQPVRVTDFGRIPDHPEQTDEVLRQAKDSTDLLITTGGVSVGDADYVRPAMEKAGKLQFWKIALKPGKPLAVGTLGNTLFLGLPGNPVSVIVTYLLFVVPAIKRLSGETVGKPIEFKAKLDSGVQHSPGRREFQRGRFMVNENALTVTPVIDQGSNRLESMSRANCLIVVPESTGSLPVGSTVSIVLLPDVAHTLWSDDSVLATPPSQ